MLPDRAQEVADVLRGWGVAAHVAKVSPFRHGVRVVINLGTEAVWDTDGAAGLEAQVLGDGVLIGFIPPLPDSDADGITAEQQARMIAAVDYTTIQK
jgi:hypothetical protein